jgi:hypothetical protein
MDVRESHGLAKLGAIFLGIGMAAGLVLMNGIAASELLPSSYDRFTWQAYEEVVYTSTPTMTPTATATLTPTPSEREDTEPGGCDDGIDNDQDGAIDCADADCLGTPPCVAPAPVMSYRSLGIVVVLLVMIGFFALTPLRLGKRD